MSADDILKSLHPLEVKVLLHYGSNDIFDANRIQEDVGLNLGQCNQAVSWLAAKALIVEHERHHRTLYEITELGESLAADGTPEERILAHVSRNGPAELPRIAEALQLESRDVGSSFGALSREGVLEMNGAKQVSVASGTPSERMRRIRVLLDRARGGKGIAAERLTQSEREAISGISKKRGSAGAAFRVVERDEVTYRLTEAGLGVQERLQAAGITGEEIGALTPQMLKDGSWRGVSFRAYNIHVPPTRMVPGHRNPYCEYLDRVKDKLVSLGFEEFDGPIVETEFWNSDALFMPQFHSARDIHDVYYVKQPTHARGIEEPYLGQVAETHENGWRTGSSGWGYRFDRDFTRRLILRSQGTVMSARTLPRARIPGKYFGTLRCFRYDQVDATHLSDFYQTEGIVLGESVNLRTLLGFLQMFAEELAGATEVKYVPGYFPFTEPSVEVHIKHPVLGWFELGGSGIFRPEVTEPLGIKVPVLAWGLGIDRMALMNLGIDDLRELFSTNIESVRLRRGN
ncbi:MAG: phenylalanine--tRNA ligase subunit alpha [Spirochaetaceae bacterium]|nr:MAG: phenylalanine--tRNA ligase subunit alpha [Spirochaetaceae bacterium]